MDDGTIADGAASHENNDDTGNNGNGALNSQTHKRSLSGSILSKLSFLRASSSDNTIDSPPSPEYTPGDDLSLPKKASRSSLAAVVQQQKTRRRKGSLRKAALLGRGAQRERKESKLNTQQPPYGLDGTVSPTSPEDIKQPIPVGLGISDATPRPSMDGYASRNSNVILPPLLTSQEDLLLDNSTSTTTTTSPLAYTSTTDEEDILHILPHHQSTLRDQTSLSSSSESYFPLPPPTNSLIRRRSSQKPKSPLSIAGLTASPLPTPNDDWDYSDTEWWGWVILIITWLVFVVGMGSCTDVWSWAWDVGETAPAPPELEDDPTLPIVGYYPALMILTCIMAWVWVVVAWVGMKYFRHAKISGD